MPLRIVIGPMPRIMEDILRAAARGRTDVRLVAVIEEWHQLAERVAALGPDAVILGEHASTGAVRDTLLHTHPEITVLTLSDNARESRGYWVGTFGALSAEEILRVISWWPGQSVTEGEIT